MDYKTINDSIIKAEDSYTKYKTEIQKDRCDKYDLSFDISNDRFKILGIDLTMNSYIGYYGNSCCRNGLYLDNAFTDHFIKWLNKNIDNVITGTIELMKENRAEYIGAEITKITTYLDELKKTEKTLYRK